MRFLLFLFFFFFFCGLSIVFDGNCLIQAFNGLAGILHQFHGVNWLVISNHRHLDVKTLKANALDANYSCKVQYLQN